MMSKPFFLFLLAVFSIHLAIFLRLAVRHRKVYHLLAVLTFSLMLISTSARLAWPQVHLGHYPLYACFKYAAWLTTTAAIITYLHYRYFK